jgi:tripartite-type tricarboxylate transporter receptor subunit TctC
MDTYATGNPHVAAGKLRALAYASRSRSPLMPNVPTVAEMGLPGYEGILWIGMLAPAGTPKPVVDRLAAAASKAVRSDELRARLTRDGVDPVGNTPAEFAAIIARELVQWRDLVKAANIKAE